MILSNNQQVKQLIELLAKRSKIVVTTHQNPDGDALGSMLGLYGYFKKSGHDVFALAPNEYPEFLQWLPWNGEVIDYSRHKKKAERIISEAQFIFYLDYNDGKRGDQMKETLAASKATKVMIDHHPYPQLPVDFSLSFTEVSSTAELVYEFLQELDGCRYLDKDIAGCIYTGIMTDTGCFSYNSSRARTFEIAAQLLGYSIEKDEIYRRVYDNFSAQRMRLLGFCLNDKMQVFPEYHTAFIAISIEEQKRYHFTTGDSEGFVNLPLSIKGVCFTALFIEKKDKVKISFRSRGKFPVNLFSEKHFMGGGHLNAAGGECSLTLDGTIKKFIELLPLYAQELNA